MASDIIIVLTESPVLQQILSAIDDDNEDMAISLLPLCSPKYITNPYNDDGITLLILACDRGMTRLAHAIIDTGYSNPGHITDGLTTLMYACTSDELDSSVAISIINTGHANIDHIEPHSGSTALLLACFRKRWDIVHALIDSGLSLPNHCDNYGVSAIHFTIAKYKPSIAFKLLNTGYTDIAMTEPITGNTPLMNAIKFQHYDLAIKLLQTGKSNPGHINKLGDTALLLICNKQPHTTRDIYHNTTQLRKYNYRMRLMVQICKLLLDSGDANPNAVNSHGHTALYLACCYHYIELVKTLMDSGLVNPGYATDIHDSALQVACVAPWYLNDVALLLLQYHDPHTDTLNINHITKLTGNTALIIACWSHNYQIIRAILKFNNINTTHANNNGATALQCFKTYAMKSLEYSAVANYGKSHHI